MKKLSLLLLLCACYAAEAQDYNVLLIPDSLLKNADVVVRDEEYHVEVKSLEDVIIKHKYAITVLNEKGDDYARYYNTYTDHEPLKDIDGNLYDATGKKLKNVKRKDILDVPLEDGSSLMGDTRIKSHNWYWKTYPYTVEYEDEQELNETLNIPGWRPVDKLNCAIQDSKFTIDYPTDFKLRFKQINYKGQPLSRSDKVLSLSWELKNFKAVNDEPLCPSLFKIVPYVLIAPTEFAYEGYHGNMNSWIDLGKFQLALNKDRDILPDKVKKQVHSLVDNLILKEDKVNILYQYLQNNSRYINISLGIGGLQPFDAKYVAEKKYGDCKALSNFMIALLKEAGIPAYYVQIKAGSDVSSDYLFEDFPERYSNHIICCVPNSKDSIWLECTSQTESAGFMGSFTGNRKALLIAEDGGHVVSTPFYKAQDNLKIRTVNAFIDSEGNLDAEVNTAFTGVQEEFQHGLLYGATKEEREKYLNRAINLPTYKVEKNNYTEEKKRIPLIHQELHITSPNYASITGKRLFIKPNIFNKSLYKLSKDSIRLYDINISSAYRDIDSVNIALPAGYTLEAMPKDVALNTKFGTYSISYKIKDNTVLMLRTDERSAATFPASDYNDLVTFYDAIYKADRSQLVFVKKEN